MQKRTGDRVVEGARLESVCTVSPYRGFESLSVRQNSKSRFDLFRNGFFSFDYCNPSFYFLFNVINYRSIRAL